MGQRKSQRTPNEGHQLQVQQPPKESSSSLQQDGDRGAWHVPKPLAVGIKGLSWCVSPSWPSSFLLCLSLFAPTRPTTSQAPPYQHQQNWFRWKYTWHRCFTVKHSIGILYLFSFSIFSQMMPFLTMPSLIWCKELEVKGFLPAHNSLAFFLS